jgi:hypothetical protein
MTCTHHICYGILMTGMILYRWEVPTNVIPESTITRNIDTNYRVGFALQSSFTAIIY